MIGRVLDAGERARGLLEYLFGPGDEHEDARNDHHDARIIAGWREPSRIEPPFRDDGSRDVSRLAALMEAPLALLDPGRRPALPVWHCTLAAAPGDPVLGDGAWAPIVRELMHRTGLDPRGREGQGVPWVAVRHADGHIHIAAVLVRADGRRAHLHYDHTRVLEAARWAEDEFGLVQAPRPDRTAPSRAGRGERAKAARHGRPEPPRDTLRKAAETAAATAATQEEFFRLLAARGLKVRLRHSPDQPADITGYAVGLDGDTNAKGGQVWYGGGKLAPYLSLPRLRRRWEGGPLSGRAMTGQTAKTVLRREVTAAAAAAWDEAVFWAGLAARGLDVRQQRDPAYPGRIAGYTAGLPGHADRAGRQIRYSGGTLAPQLRLGELRARWQAGQPGAAPPGLYDGTDAGEIYAHAARTAADAASALGTTGSGRAAIAFAAADVLTAAADATGSAGLRQAATAFGRAARVPGGRIPAPTPRSKPLRTAARLLATTRPPAYHRGPSVLLNLIRALIMLAESLAALRAAQDRRHQAEAARAAAARLRAEASERTPPPRRHAARTAPASARTRRSPGTSR